MWTIQHQNLASTESRHGRFWSNHTHKLSVDTYCCQDAYVSEEVAIGLWGEVKALYVDNGEHGVENARRNSYNGLDHHNIAYFWDSQERYDGLYVKQTTFWRRESVGEREDSQMPR